MKLSILAVVLFMFGLPGAAQARQDPPPPPSGIVVHLFGPGSIASNIMPQGTLVKAPAGPATPGAPLANQGYVEPSVHDILRQMFVTGDPDAKPGAALATGRSTERP